MKKMSIHLTRMILASTALYTAGCLQPKDARIGRSADSLEAVSTLTGEIKRETDDLLYLEVLLEKELLSLKAQKDEIASLKWTDRDSRRRAALYEQLNGTSHPELDNLAEQEFSQILKDFSQLAQVKETKAEETKAEETKAEETKAEETKAEETKAEETKAEETKAEETKAEESNEEESNEEARVNQASLEIAEFYKEKKVPEIAKSSMGSLYDVWSYRLKLSETPAQYRPYLYAREGDLECLESRQWGSVSFQKNACNELLAGISENSLDLEKKAALAAIEVRIREYEVAKDQFAKARDARMEQKKKLLESYGSSFDGMLAFAIPVVAFSVLSIFFMGHWSRREKDGEGASSEEIISVITVLLLVCLILILALADKLEKEALGTLIGGIAAYVLGDSVRRRAAERGTEPRSERRESGPKQTSEAPMKADAKTDKSEVSAASNGEDGMA